ncbi:MAG: DUF1134 domain-containing protein [Novosphingobium sp.]|uniref:DUF1134 domain-containing protein n=1 Tax=Novosphingobium sp. TaxID=1874826 RepID=UPI0012C1FDF1|nr:DUF1134 domain-containing protein [Novosphingobium sp.]MPS70889.1 DUF1134 domain-containing protein [Novosphingobium sp.]
MPVTMQIAARGAPVRLSSKLGGAAAALLVPLLVLVAPMTSAVAQVTTVDPDAAIDADISSGNNAGTSYQPPVSSPAQTAQAQPAYPGNGTPVDSSGNGSTWNGSPAPMQAPPAQSTTYHEDDLIGAAEGVFGKGAKGLAGVIEDLLKKQGEPNGYIVGREGGGAIAVGLRYGSGTLYHKIEGEQPVYWTGPSIGFDAGANAGNAFVLVYNLNDTEDLYHRFGAGEGQAYLVGGFTVSYLRRGDVVLIPVRAGAGLRLGANIGYMKFTHKQSWMPF